MQCVEKSILVLHTPAQMFSLVNDIEHYPYFLPWCHKADIHSRGTDYLVASLHINYFKIRQHFTTRNVYQDDHTILIELVEGPFDSLQGRWHFRALGETGCKIEFRLSYQFSSKLLEKLLGPVFGHISTTLVDAFIKEADRIYN